MLTEADFERVLGPADPDYREPTFDCPFCRLRLSAKQIAQGIGHLHINVDKGVAICHRCEYKTRNIRNIIYQVTGKMPRRSLNLKGGAYNTVKKILMRIDEVEEAEQIVALPEEYVPLTFPSKGIVANKCEEYLLGRGVSTSLAESCQVGYAVQGRYAGMLIFPMFVGDDLRFFTSRAVMPFAPKTLHPKSPRGGTLFNYNNASRARRVFINEGPFDALSWPRKMGVGVGTLGHHLSQAQARLLSKLPAEEFVVCYDSDCPDATVEAAGMLRKFVDADVSFIILDKGDPNSERKRLRRFFKNRQRAGLASMISRKFNS